MARPAELRKRLLEYALGLPESTDAAMSVKLAASHPLALAQPGATPTGYGLGDSGWVTVRLSAKLPLEMLRDWIDESYRTVAPKGVAPHT